MHWFLRNKKTGEIVDVYNIYISKRVEDDSLTSHENVIRSFDSIAELNEEWEDETEPLIKDEKIRKAVRAFSEVIQEKKHILVIKLYERGIAEFSNGSCFWMRLPVSSETMNALEDRTYYTITELCGEEEG